MRTRQSTLTAQDVQAHAAHLCQQHLRLRDHGRKCTAGTLLTEGTRIPARSLVMGRPGKVKRPLTDEEVAEIRWYSDNYVNYRLDYSTESRPTRPLGFK